VSDVPDDAFLPAALVVDEDPERGFARVVGAEERGDLALLGVAALGERCCELGAASVDAAEDVVVPSEDDRPWLCAEPGDDPCALAPDDEEHPDTATVLAIPNAARIRVGRILLSRMFLSPPSWAQRSPATPSVA